MTIDINLLREEKGGCPAHVAESERRRGRDPARVERLIAADKKWREATFSLEQGRKDLNAVNKEIGQRKKSDPKASCEDLVSKTTGIKARLQTLEAEAAEAATTRDTLLKSIGNIVHGSVPVSNDETNNKVVRTWGTPNKVKIDGTPGKMHHHEVLQRLHGVDFKKGVEVAGHRGYYLKGPGVMLNYALIQYGLNFLMKKGYQPVQPPFFMRKSVMGAAAELRDFEETLKEAGAHGKDCWGIFRIHQFEKIEQFCITAPEKSWDMHEEMISTAEEFYQSLELPYRVVSIVTGALNDAAAKKYDLEAWFPGYEDYRELVSCSNCTDFQARDLDIRLGHKKETATAADSKPFVHLLNATLVATQRCMCCILENYQTPTGVKVPRALVPYMGGQEFLHYPTDDEDKREAGNA
ncbi:seryl-tRNA cytoplasmic [Cyclospora cayetanensis]|uniref:serine--tRNA ligase n=1 Tax=Cyclospora cayetanensis TaxID=88456 RepID=A0A1D3D949_9EIME|nr:seryl-tRNA cytoplasmic [Cyclospora cayetanensis]